MAGIVCAEMACAETAGGPMAYATMACYMCTSMSATRVGGGSARKGCGDLVQWLHWIPLSAPVGLPVPVARSLLPTEPLPPPRYIRRAD